MNKGVDMNKLELIRDMLITGHTFEEINNDIRYLSFPKFEDSFKVARQNSEYFKNIIFQNKKVK